METSESEQLDKLFTALATAQGAIQGAKKDAINPFFKKSYATLDSIWNAIRLPLSTNELSVIQIPIKDQSGLKLITRLCHSSGQWIEGIFEIQPSKDDLQGIGSALTYARRYALAAMVGVTADEDDDGNNETPSKQNKSKNGLSNGDNRTPQSLLEKLNIVVGIEDYYKNLNHLLNAVRKAGGQPDWEWPESDSKQDWIEAFVLARDHAKANKSERISQDITPKAGFPPADEENWGNKDIEEIF